MRRATALGASTIGVLGLVAVGVNVWPHQPDGGSIDGPVISIADGWNAYPAALVTGRLTLHHGCLLLGDSVVFWPHGSTWDADAEAVVFDDSASAPVGSDFTGGGGFYSTENLRGLDGLDAGPVLTCMQQAHSAEAVFAYPSE